MEDMQHIYQLARAYVHEHGHQCAKEILAWRKTGIYNGQALAELAKMLSPIYADMDMRKAEDLVVEVALNKLASPEIAAPQVVKNKPDPGRWPGW